MTVSKKSRLKVTLFVFPFVMAALYSCYYFEPVHCVKCENLITVATFSNRYLRHTYSSASNNTFIEFFFGVDSINHTTITDAGNRVLFAYEVCDFPGNVTLDTVDVIKASGKIAIYCAKARDSILIFDNYKIVNSCRQTVPNLTGTFGLRNRIWICESVQANNTTYIPPCFSSPSVYLVDSLGSVQSFIHGMNNSRTGTFELKGQDSVKIITGSVTENPTFSPYQADFNNALLTPFDSQKAPYVTLGYTIANNRLTLKSKNGTIIRMYCEK